MRKILCVCALILGLVFIAGPAMAVDLPQIACNTGNLTQCTAKEITTVSNVEIVNNRCEDDGKIDLQITADFSTKGGDTRYDLGVIVAEDGGSLEGKTPSARVCSGAYGPIPPFVNLDGTTGDTCGDINTAVSPVRWTFNVTADCSNVVDGTLMIPSCRFWNIPGQNDFCTGLPGPSAGTGSKCDCSPFEVTVPSDLCDGVNCDDSNVCTTDTCDAGECQHVNNENACDDGNSCTEGDTCSAGSCVGGSALNCDDGDACTTDSCDVVTGCAHETIPGCGTPAPEFPSLALPAALIIGFVGVVFFILESKKQ